MVEAGKKARRGVEHSSGHFRVYQAQNCGIHSRDVVHLQSSNGPRCLRLLNADRKCEMEDRMRWMVVQVEDNKPAYRVGRNTSVAASYRRRPQVLATLDAVLVVLGPMKDAGPVQMADALGLVKSLHVAIVK